MKRRSNRVMLRWKHALLASSLALDLALIATLALAAAYCTWLWFAPRATAAPPPRMEARAPESQPPSAAASRLFSGAAAQAQSTAAVRLIGVVAPRRALFIVDNGRPRSAAVGQSIGGLELLEVYPDHVVVDRGGVRERISLVRNNAGR